MDTPPPRAKPVYPIASRRIIRLSELRSLARRVWVESTTDHVSLAAAGCAFYATLALFPAISVLISAYGLIFDPVAVDKVKETQNKLADFLESRKASTLAKILAGGKIDEEIEKELAAAIEEFKSFNI